MFPKCNLTCTPCYHSADANKVRVDGAHTVRQVDAQMAYLRERRGPYAHAQLIGGEVSLLEPDDHAAVPDYLRVFVLDDGGGLRSEAGELRRARRFLRWKRR